MTIDELDYRLNNEILNVYKCVLINGEWGIGKTYFLKNKFLTGNNCIYISLFGVNSVENVKIEIYSKLNKTCSVMSRVKKAAQKFGGINIELGLVSLPINYWETDIYTSICKEIKDKVLTIVIDDLERKSKRVDMEELLGTIEAISEIKNINLILVANENKMRELDKEKFLKFKEKVIQKTYNVHKYSKDAPRKVAECLLENLKLKAKVDNTKIIGNILEVFENHSVNNLRTLEKGINFLKLILQNIELDELNDDEIKNIIIASLAIVIEIQEKIYTVDEKNSKNKGLVEKIIEDSGKELDYCIINNYFKESYFTSEKSTIVGLLLDIYYDKDVQNNFKKLNKFYKDLHTIDKNKEYIDLFYMSEEKLERKIDDFYINCIVNINKSLDVNNWFKKLNEIYTYAKLIGKDSIFKDKEVFKAMDVYIENLEFKEGLFYLLDKHIPYEMSQEKMIEYNEKLNKKITEKYYFNAIEEIIKKIREGDFAHESLERLYSIYDENSQDIDKNKIISMMEENKYFIPDLNYEISDKIWSWAHLIWKNAKRYEEKREDKGFEQCVNNLLKDATVLGKYRIESLNQKYGISIEDLE